MSFTRTISRRRVALALAAAGAALPVSSALAAPTAPVLNPLTSFVDSTAPTLVWTPSTFAGDAIAVGYTVEFTDLTTGTPAQLVGAPGVEPFKQLNLANGHLYNLRVRGWQFIDPPGPVPLDYETSPWSAARTTRVDNTAPTGTLAINGGAQFTNSLDVTLNMDATDPLSNGFLPSGVNKVQISDSAAFPCPFPANLPTCPVNYAPTKAHALPAGPDGPRTVRVRFRDSSRAFFSPFATMTGNVSSTKSSTILLDRVAPTIALSIGPNPVTAGTPVAFDASGSTDGVAGPNDSGVDPAGYSWIFGDGATGSGATTNHTYGAPGIYSGTLTIRDRAGNTRNQAFQVQVIAPPAAAQPQGGATTQAPEVVKFSMSGIRRHGKIRQGRRGKISVVVSKRTVITGALVKKVRGKNKVVRRFRALAPGSGRKVLLFRAPKAGTYRVVLKAQNLTRTRGIRVVRR